MQKIIPGKVDSKCKETNRLDHSPSDEKSADVKSHKSGKFQIRMVELSEKSSRQIKMV